MSSRSPHRRNHRRITTYGRRIDPRYLLEQRLRWMAIGLSAALLLCTVWLVWTHAGIVPR